MPRGGAIRFEEYPQRIRVNMARQHQTYHENNDQYLVTGKMITHGDPEVIQPANKLNATVPAGPTALQLVARGNHLKQSETKRTSGHVFGNETGSYSKNNKLRGDGSETSAKVVQGAEEEKTRQQSYRRSNARDNERDINQNPGPNTKMPQVRLLAFQQQAPANHSRNSSTTAENQLNIGTSIKDGINRRKNPETDAFHRALTANTMVEHNHARKFNAISEGAGRIIRNMVHTESGEPVYKEQGVASDKELQQRVLARQINQGQYSTPPPPFGLDWQQQQLALKKDM